MIYFLRHKSVGPVKIGYTGDLEARRYLLSRQYRVELRLIRVIPTRQRWAEIWLHKRFIALRVAGEWFQFHPDMLTVTIPDKAPGFASDYLPLPNIKRERFGSSIADQIHAIIMKSLA